MKLVELTKGQFAKVDDADYDRVMKHCWQASMKNGRYYAQATICKPSGNERVYLHRFIMGIYDERNVDHIDGDALNCQRYNLRACTQSQNLMNSGKSRSHNHQPTSSQYKGVCRVISAKQTWQSQICFNHHVYYLGRFKNEIEAAAAYDRAASEMAGEYARLNFPSGSPMSVK